MADTVQVAVRIRPLNQSEQEKHSGLCLEPAVDEPQISVPPNLNFTYNFVFDQTKSQEEVYNSAVKNLIIKLFKGKHFIFLHLVISCRPCRKR